MTKHRHYFHKIPPGITEADIYRLIDIIGITCPVAQHVFKKSAAAGKRGHKDLRKDWQDILDSAKRKLEMLDEDAAAETVERMQSDDDPDARMDQIARNGNDGLHYESLAPAPVSEEEAEFMKQIERGIKQINSGAIGINYPREKYEASKSFLNELLDAADEEADNIITNKKNRPFWGWP